jgi:hypothetical protein
VSKEAEEPIVFGNWYLPGSKGVMGLSTAQTGGLIGGGIFVFILASTAGMVPGVIGGVVLLAFVFMYIKKDKHRVSIAERIRERMVYQMRKRNGTDTYKSGILVKGSGAKHSLPGILRSCEFYEMTDNFGTEFVVVHIPAQKTYSVVFTCEPNGAALVDPSTINQWVAHFGGWMNRMSDKPNLVGLQITVDILPTSGVEIKKELSRFQSESSPEFATRVIEEVKEIYPAIGANIKIFATAIFSYASNKNQKFEYEEIGSSLKQNIGSYTADLRECGVSYVAPTTAKELYEMIRVAYDPEIQFDFENARANEEDIDLNWNDVGPTLTKTYYDYFVHDSGISTNWTMSRPPSSVITYNSMEYLLSSHGNNDRRRISVMYRTSDSGKSPQIAEKDREIARQKAVNQKKNTITAESRKLMDLADFTAGEINKGANIIEFGMVVTTTSIREGGMSDEGIKDKIRELSSMTENLAAATKIHVRPAYGTQDSAFIQNLSLGVMFGAPNEGSF